MLPSGQVQNPAAKAKNRAKAKAKAKASAGQASVQEVKAKTLEDLKTELREQLSTPWNLSTHVLDP